MSADWIIPREIPSDRTLRELSQQYREADPSAIETLLTLLRTAGEVHTAMDQRFARHDLSHGRFVVLIMLHTTPGGEMCCSDIADSVGVSRATMTGPLAGLERDRLIRRLAHRDDPRRVTIALSGGGRRLLDEILQDHFRKVAGLMAGLNADD